MRVHGKRYRAAVGTLEPRKLYPPRDAVERVKAAAYAKFDESVDVAVRLGVDPKHADQVVRGTVSLPNGTGKKVTVERKIYPGYVLVNMVLNQETIHVINGIQGVIKFVGTGRMPMPLRADEVNRLLGIEEAVKEEEPQEHIPFLVGQVVEITEGPFSDFSGTVEEVIPDKGKVRVAVSLFGRPTSVELDYLQLKAH